MITVAILINGKPLYTRSAYRAKGYEDDVCIYKCDDGSIISHSYKDGAIKLAHKLLDTIKELSKRDLEEKRIREEIELLYKQLNKK